MTAAPRPPEEAARSRYPGTRPFTDSPEDYVRFFGRTEESEQLYLRVLSVPLLVQFGSSGLGKTSLLQAGLFPRLRRKPFLPVMVRLNVPGESLTAAVARSIRQSCEAEGAELAAGSTEGLWELLSTTTVWRGDFLLTPVLTFDQFEEVFTLRDDAFREDIAAELGALASGIPPERLRAKGAPPLPEVKIIISLREDYLGFLEQFSAAIPGLFHERLRLEPLNADHAKESILGPAMLVPAEGEKPYSSPPFDFEPEALAAMLADLKGRSGVIEPFHLQLLCRNAEEIARRKPRPDDGRPVTLTTLDFRGSASFEAVMTGFYRGTLRLVSGASQRKKAEVLCQEGLLGASGHRLMPEEGEILSGFGVTAETLDVLCRERLIRRERRLESVYYEISHDRLAETIFNARKSRMPRKVKRALAAGVVLGVALLIGLAFWLVTVNRARDEALQARDNSDRVLRFLLGEQFLGEVRDSGRSGLLEKVQGAVGESSVAASLSSINRGLALRNSGDIFRTRGSLNKALDAFGAALPFFEETPDDPTAIREAARTHERIAGALMDGGKSQEALTHLAKAANGWRRVVKEPVGRNPLLASDCMSLASTVLASGTLKGSMGRAKAALEDIETASRIASNRLFGGLKPDEECGVTGGTATPYPDPKAVEVLSGVAMMRAQLLGFDEDATGAAALALEARKLNPSSVTARKNALVALTWRGGMRRDDRPDLALNDFRSVLAESEELRRWDPEDRLWQRERAAAELLVSEAMVACHTKGLPGYNTARTLDDAHALALDAGATIRSLSRLDPNNMMWQSDLAWALQDQSVVLGEQAVKTGGRAAFDLQTQRVVALEGAEAIYRASLARFAVDERSSFSTVLALQAEALAKVGRGPEAREKMKEAVDVAVRLTTEYPDHPSYVGTLVNVRDREAAFLRQAGDRAGAKASEAEAERVDEKWDAMLGVNRNALDELGKQDVQHAEEGMRLEESDDAGGALREFRASERVGRDYLRLRPIEWGVYRDLSFAYRKIAENEARLGHRDREGAARSAAMHAAQVAVWLAPDSEKENAESKLLGTRFDFGNYLHDRQRLAEALPMMQEVVVVGETLTRTSPKTRDYLFYLGAANCKVGEIRRARGQHEGWEEAVRSGLIYLQRAADMEGPESFYAQRLGEWRQYLARQLESEGEKDNAAAEYARALEAFEKAAGLAPSDETMQTAVEELRAKLKVVQG
jgi:tetratricopeptide (TPR) repeat protein